VISWLAYKNLISYVWHEVAQKVLRHQINVPNPQELIAQLSSRELHSPVRRRDGSQKRNRHLQRFPALTWLVSIRYERACHLSQRRSRSVRPLRD